MNEQDLKGLLASIAEGDLESLPILCDLLEEMGDPRASEVRGLYVGLRDDWFFAPFTFRYVNQARDTILPLFPEYDEEAAEGDR
jgi:hypothetical protein